MNQQEAIEAAKALPGAYWIAMDDDGEWRAFTNHPWLDADGIWKRPRKGGWGAPIGETWSLGYQEVEPKAPIEVPR